MIKRRGRLLNWHHPSPNNPTEGMTFDFSTDVTCIAPLHVGSSEGDGGEGSCPGWRKREKPCPESRKHDMRALFGTDWKRVLKKRTWSEIGVERKERR
ncbi:hypothetical protein TNCV_203341 [Trichonephila clavipes]|nr:hypothetical protein TNCV_203341 [Trichonephila clavipes]